MSLSGWSPFLLKNSDSVSFGFFEMKDMLELRERSILETLTLSNGNFGLVICCCSVARMLFEVVFLLRSLAEKNPFIFLNIETLDDLFVTSILASLAVSLV